MGWAGVPLVCLSTPQTGQTVKTLGQGLGKGSTCGAQQRDGGKSYENQGCDPLHGCNRAPDEPGNQFMSGARD
jgi:hypothetical protein